MYKWRKNKLKKEIGERIRKLREEQGITREELATRAEITTKFLYEVENGKKGMSANNLYKISRELSSSCDYILLGRNKADSGSEVERLYSDFLKEMNEEQKKIMIKILELLLEYSKEKSEQEL